PTEIINCNTSNSCHERTHSKNFVSVYINTECMYPLVADTYRIPSALLCPTTNGTPRHILQTLGYSWFFVIQSSPFLLPSPCDLDMAGGPMRMPKPGLCAMFDEIRRRPNP